MDSAAAERLARRYPTRSRGWLDWRLLAVAFGLLGVAWVGWVAVEGAVPPVAARVDAFEVRSTTEVDVTVTMEREDVARAAQCLLYVQAVSYERVGEVLVEVPAGGGHSTSQQVTVRTFKRGTSAALESCRAVG
ncbi:MAG: DUF4307 domain-containing protein [Propionicimonas sp.]|nr:DUF4307 domain-containing protein [Propionicimonas sp.]